MTQRPSRDNLPLIVEPERCFAFSSLNFTMVPVQSRSTHGTPFVRWVPVGMPKLPPNSLDCVCYLYASKEDARDGRRFGGTAFLVSVPSRVPNKAYFYAVTTWHTAVRDGASMLRINTHDGKGDLFEFGPEEWHFDPRFDIAVRSLRLDKQKHKYKIIPFSGLVTEKNVADHEIGPGDDVFMVGRFVDHDGGPVNRPAVRFGHISVMPSPIEQPNGKMAPSYCIDMHSRSGYSGSPVFIYRTPGSDLSEQLAEKIEDAHILLAGANYLALLGIHFAQFPEEWELKERKKSPAESESFQVPLITEGAYVKGLSGMTCVLPAWSIIDVLNSPAVADGRNRNDDRLERELRESGQVPPDAEAGSS